MRERNARSSKKKIIITILAAIVLIAAFGAAMHFIEKHGEKDEQFGDTGDWGGADEEEEDTLLVFEDDQYYSKDSIEAYVLAGTDVATNMGKGYNGTMADFICLLLIDNTTQKYAFYQIDRNSMVEIGMLTSSDYVNQQICTSHWYGEDESARNDNLVDAVMDLTGGLDVDGYFILNMNDIGKVNNAIGGVVVEIPEDMTNIDPEFKKGESVLLSDDQAEKFLRARKNMDDNTNKARMSRQQIYMQNAYNMIISQLRENGDYIDELYAQLSDIIQSDDYGNSITGIASKLVKYKNVGILTFSGETTTNDTLGDGTEYEEFYVNNDSIVANLRKVMKLEPYTDEDEDEGEYFYDDEEEDEETDSEGEN